MAERKDPRDIVDVSTRQGWRKWLEDNYATSSGAWLIMYKKASLKKGPSYEDAVEEALCFGWIDSRPNVLDQQRYKLLFVPRQPGSTWARSNKIRVEKLIKESLMTPAGLAKIEQAKRDGSWDQLDEIEALMPPEDLKEALKVDPVAAKNFAEYSKSSKKMILWWLFGSRRPGTRSQRIQRIVDASSKGEKISDLFWKRKT
jgi:uncharacterized protein YdeI (YjbR/CyaY-like superfamily)